MTAKKICVLGNMNNYPLILAEGLRSIGHDTSLFFFRSDRHHRPESKYPALEGNYPDWINDYTKVKFDDFIWRTPAYVNLLGHIRELNFDFIIANDFGISMVDEIGRPHATMIAGSDLTYLGNYDSLNLIKSVWSHSFSKSYEGRQHIRAFSDLISRQRSGLMGARFTGYPPRGLVADGDAVLDSIGIKDDERVWMHFSDTISLTQTELPSDRRLRIVNGARVQWIPTTETSNSSLDLKGTDVLLAGFALYLKAGGDGELFLIRKGPDLEAAQRMIDDLNVGSNIVWLEEMSLEQYRALVTSSHIVCDHFGEGAPGMVYRDALAQGRPVLANLRNDIHGTLLPEPFPGLDAWTAEQVADHLVRADKDRPWLAELGRTSRHFADKYLSAQAYASRVVELMS